MRRLATITILALAATGPASARIAGFCPLDHESGRVRARRSDDLGATQVSMPPGSGSQHQRIRGLIC